MSFVRESVTVGGKTITFETGRLAKQAHGSILISLGDTVVLVTARSAVCDRMAVARSSGTPA